MAPTPITANYRISFKYTVDLFQHRANMYLDCTASGDPSGYNTVARAGFAPVGVSELEQWFFTAIQTYFDPTWASFDGYDLYVESAGSFIPVASGVATITPDGSGAVQLANGGCVSMKDAFNRNMPFYFYEGLVGIPNKISSYAALSVAGKYLVNYLTNAGGTATDFFAYAWRQARSGVYVDRWIANVTDSNEKLRRLRRIK